MAMVTRWTQTLIPTSRQVPAEAEVPSHQLMLRAGLIRKLGSGVYEYLPLGLRSLQKVIAIVREEMDAAGAVEVMLPALQPIELWEQTGRRAAYGQNLFVIKDRHGREQALGPTHEEVVTELVGAYVESYKQLPLTLYQIQAKFRDEVRPRFGVLRSREFLMKDAYSFHLRLEGPGGLSETYQKQYDAYCRIFSRCGLPYEVVEAESGPIGGSASHEFMVPSPTGEDLILKSDKGNYAANVEKCEIGERAVAAFLSNGPYVTARPIPDREPTGNLEEVLTPSCSSIEDLCTSWPRFTGGKLKPTNILKTLVYQGPTKNMGSQGQSYDWVVAVVRGDHQVNEAKIRGLCGDRLVLAEGSIAEKEGFAVGFLGPHIANEMQRVWVVVDPDAAQDQFWVTGANKPDHHVRHFHWKRDLFQNQDMINWFRSHTGCGFCVADIRNAVDGDPSPKNDGGVLRVTRGIEVGHVFKLGDKYTKALNVAVRDENNQRVAPLMGCYGIGVNRILASAIERSGPQKGHDEKGIIWPASIAPYAVVITPIKYDGPQKETADRLAAQLEQAGIDVLIDDRDERSGVKFNDADLIGFPLRITIGKALAEGNVEVKPRATAKTELVPVDSAAARAAELLQTL
jgi:prolyl-tRNA synthetase